MLDNYIEQLAKELELEGSLTTQVPGAFNFPLEENLSVSITNHFPGFVLSCTLGGMPKHEEEAFYTRLMMGNLFGQGTKGAILGLNDDATLLTLNQTVDYNAEYKEFRDILEDFVNSVDFWRDELNKYSK